MEHDAGGVDDGEQRGFEVAREGGLGPGDDLVFRRRRLAGGDARPRPLDLTAYRFDDSGPRVAGHGLFEAGVARHGVHAGQPPVPVAGAGAVPGLGGLGASRASHGLMVAQGGDAAPVRPTGGRGLS